MSVWTGRGIYGYELFTTLYCHEENNSMCHTWTQISNVLIIYIIISKNIRYLLWNRGAWRFFHDTYLTIEVQVFGAPIIYTIPVPLLT